MSSPQGKKSIVCAPCTACGHATDHDILNARECELDLGKPGAELPYKTMYETLECRGCHSIRLKVSSGFYRHEDLTVEYNPPTPSRPIPPWLMMEGYVSQALCDLLKEINSALTHDCWRLAAMGMRALLDMVMAEKVGDLGGFDKKLSRFQDAGYISPQQWNLLVPIIQVGNAAAHRGFCPQAHDLTQAMDIVESILADIYLHPELAAKLKSSVPPRKTVKNS